MTDVPIPGSDPEPRPSGRFRLDKEGTGATLKMGLIVEPAEQSVIEGWLRDSIENLPHKRPPYPSPEEYDELFRGSAEQTADLFSRRLRGRQSKVEIRGEARHVAITGSLRELEDAFGTEFVGVEEAGVRYRAHRRGLTLPERIATRVTTIDGLDDRPFPLDPVSPGLIGVGDDNYRVREVIDHYRFPDNQGAGQVVGIIVLGGGYHREDIEAFCRAEGVEVPEIVDQEVGAAANQPADRKAIVAALDGSGFERQPLPAFRGGFDRAPEPSAAERAFWTIETTADIEIVAACVPKARIVVFFAENRASCHVDAMLRALGSDLEERLRPTVLSCSWGTFETGYPIGSRRYMGEELVRAACQGVSVCFASGNFGGGHVYFPASDPHVLACGGTGILSAPHDTRKVEQAWREPLGKPVPTFPASGGGLSRLFDRPSWQMEIDAAPTGLPPGTGRAVPDVSAHARIASGYRLVIGGNEVAMGGTSCATPLWAGLLARINVANADLSTSVYRVGLVTPHFYNLGLRGGFQPITRGDTGLYAASAGFWNPCTGLGRPRGRALAEALRGGA